VVSTEEAAPVPDSHPPSDSEFARKVVVVTGGSAGIGRAVAQRFAKRGAHVVIAGRNIDAANRAADEIARETKVGALAVQVDVSVPEQCEKLVAEAVAHFGALDVLVNNAAHFAVVALLDAHAEEAARFLDTNIRGPLLCARALARWAVGARRTATIVNISSIAGARPAPGCGLYSASKAALDSLTRSMALEWTPRGIRVNAVAPGHVNTEGVMADFAAGRLDYAAMIGRIPAGRIADVQDVAEAVIFLASERSRHIVGQTLTVDGGEGF
jgi:NAD(P)-dependent dehydrogenase (short-subunit alcohol dehydrogenase family)